MTLGTLEEITNLRDVWPNEAHDFTPWLAENIDNLGRAIGIDIEIEDTESPVGDFSVDIFARDADTGRKIVIENQLEDTNHDHLGKLITYASGKSAELVIWIVKRAREEHRAAIEWLNNHTDEGIGFVLCEIKLFRIGESIPAPMFDVIESPNDWVKEMKKAKGSVTRTQLPTIMDMLGWGIVKAGDMLKVHGRDDEAELQENGHVLVDGEDMSIHHWLHLVMGWSSVETYKYAEHIPTGKPLSQLRKEYMENNED